MKKNIVLLISVVGLLLVMMPEAGHIAHSQDDVKQQSLTFHNVDFAPVQDENGIWFMPDGSHLSDGVSTQAIADSGGPDEFGYTWTDAALSWVSANGGTDTGLAGGGNPAYTGLIDIGFPFKFYENTYEQLYISRHGFVSFDNTDLYNIQSHIPSPEPPNDVIAPHWVPSDDANYIRYLRGGSAPNRWFVVEWNQLHSEPLDADDSDDFYTFEVILSESGDILFQYETMAPNWDRWCESSGIEDMTGLDGLTITDFCDPIASNNAVQITRPADAARVRVYPGYGGRFAHPGQVETFEIDIRNTGGLGTDTFDLYPTSSGWTTTLYQADGVTLLSDTDGDLVVDTGSLAQAEQATVIARIETPTSADAGDDNSFELFVRSSVDTSVSKMAQIRTAVPTQFGQISIDSADNVPKLSLYQPPGRTEISLASSGYFSSGAAITNTPDDGFFSAWARGRLNGNGIYVREIIYALANKYGDIVRPATKLSQYNNASIATYDYDPAVAVTPDGHFGVLWQQSKYNNSSGNDLYNYNIYFAIFSATGDVIYGPVNLTNNTLWGEYNTDNVPRFYSPHLVATANNRFVYVWEKRVYQSGIPARNISYGVSNSTGTQVKGVSAYTNAAANWSEGYMDPNVVPLSSNRILLLMNSEADADILAAVFDSNGNTVIGLTNVSKDGSNYYDYRADAVQMDNGRILVAWSYWDYSEEKYRISYTLLNSSLGTVAGPIKIINPPALFGDDYVSVTTGPNSKGVLTWFDSNWSYRPNLYYAVVNGTGVLETEPVIIESSGTIPPRIESNYYGYGNAEFTWTPPTDPDVTFKGNQTVQGVMPGGETAVIVDFANYGQTTATGVTLMAELDTHLTYTGDGSGITPTITSNPMSNGVTAVGETVTWNLPDIRFFERDGFSIFVELADGVSMGESYPVTLTITSISGDVDTSNNERTVMVWASQQVYLPVVMKPFD